MKKTTRKAQKVQGTSNATETKANVTVATTDNTLSVLEKALKRGKEKGLVTISDNRRGKGNSIYAIQWDDKDTAKRERQKIRNMLLFPSAAAFATASTKEAKQTVLTDFVECANSLFKDIYIKIYEPREADKGKQEVQQVLALQAALQSMKK